MPGRLVLSQAQIEDAAERLLRRCAPTSLAMPQMTPLVETVVAECRRLGASLDIRAQLGVTELGQPIRGCCRIRKPYEIGVSADLNINGPRFRFTLAHELGHLELHRDIDLAALEGVTDSGEIRDDDRALFQGSRHLPRSERYWLEWQANAFAAAFLMPRATVATGLVQQQKQIGVRNHGSLYVDRQPDNVRDYQLIVRALADVYQASKTSVIYRLKSLGLVKYAADYRPPDFNSSAQETAPSFRHVLDFLKQDDGS